MLDSKIRGRWDKLVRPVGRSLGRLPISANAITIGGLIVHIGVAAAIIQGRLLLAGLVAIASGVADVLDGAVAKARGTASKFGGLLDSTTDRLADALFFVPIAWLYGVEPDTAARAEQWVAAMSLAALVASFLVSYVKARAEGLGYECNVGLVERAERFILIVLALVFDFIPIMVTVLAVLGAVTFLQRLIYVRRQMVDAS